MEEMTPAAAAGGGGGGGTNPTPPGKATLVAPANNKTCETGTSVSDTQSTVAFSWNASASTNTYDVRITNLEHKYSYKQKRSVFNKYNSYT